MNSMIMRVIQKLNWFINRLVQLFIWFLSAFCLVGIMSCLFVEMACRQKDRSAICPIKLSIKCLFGKMSVGKYAEITRTLISSCLVVTHILSTRIDRKLTLNLCLIEFSKETAICSRYWKYGPKYLVYISLLYLHHNSLHTLLHVWFAIQYTLGHLCFEALKHWWQMLQTTS